MSTQIQSILFDKKYFDTITARKWLKKNKFIPIKRVHITKNKLRYRINIPEKYSKFRIKKITKGIEFVIGIN